MRIRTSLAFLVLTIILSGSLNEALANPQPPIGAKVLEETPAFTLYEITHIDPQLRKVTQKRMIFDVSKARTGMMLSYRFNSNEQLVTLDYADRRPWVIEGRHRAVAAANGYKIPRHLGGTTEHGWLDYAYINEDNPRYVTKIRNDMRINGMNLLSDFNVDWNEEEHNCRVKNTALLSK